MRYEIHVEGIVDQSWSSWFDGMQITSEPGNGTAITGEVADQAALHGVLARVRDIGLAVISVTRIDRGQQGDIMNTNTHDQKPVLVTGATGKTGRRIVERLTSAGLPVRAGSRAAEPPFDWYDPTTWDSALEGVSSAYISYWPDLAAPGAVEATSKFSKLAVEKGIRRLVLLAGRGEAEAERAEQAVAESGADLTIVRSTWFMQNFSEGDFLGQVLSGEVTLPASDMVEPFVDADDIADVAVAALTEDGHVGELYEMTGPRLLSFAEAIEEIANATGREIRYAPVSVDEFASTMAAQNVPPEAIAIFSFLFGEILDGRNAHLTDGVQRALGREPRDFRDFVRDAAATGVWDPKETS